MPPPVLVVDTSRVAPARIVISHCQPTVDGGKYAAKAVTGEDLLISATIITDGTDQLLAAVHYGPARGKKKTPSRTPGWQTIPLQFLGNDAWQATISFAEVGPAEFVVVAAIDYYGTWLRDLLARKEAGQDILPEFEEGARIVERTLKLSTASAKEKRLYSSLAEGLRSGDLDSRLTLAKSAPAVDLMQRTSQRRDLSSTGPFPVWVDIPLAQFSAWYEMFPRSSGTLQAAKSRLPGIAKMGFDVVYLPPIHPIGVSNRKGRNNQLQSGPGDVGSPWAIGSADGGHTAIDPGLGDFSDFADFVAAARENHLQVALDFAAQCSPDHPWVKEHPQWFYHRSDGSIRYAENPPKRYQDIYPLNFDSDDWENLWHALLEVVLFWIKRGVTIFRVDNPHTKPFPFWEWLIAEVRKRHPEIIFLAEAFTRPAVMQHLAKIGFSQSYTYFTWRNSKFELASYFAELASDPLRNYFRPNFWVNTPDILHAFLQEGGPAAFRIRAVLASMGAPSWGMYSGYELFEGQALHPGSEEYLNSEKYEIKHRDWSDSRSLAPFIARLNGIRNRHQQAISNLRDLVVHETDNDLLLCFSRQDPAGADELIVVVNLDPHHAQEGTVHLNPARLLTAQSQYKLVDELDAKDYAWHGSDNYVRLDPASAVAHIFHLQT